MKIEAVFLDRDGVINHQKDDEDIIEWKNFKLIKNSDKAIRLLNEKKIKTIIVTNQPAVAKGLCTEKDIINLNKRIVNFLQKRNTKIDAVYYCPHYPKRGFKNENLKYKIKCTCRKPKIGMLLKAKKKFHLNLKNCFMIGDRTRDIKTGKNAGCKTILVKTGKCGRDGKYKIKPDYVCKDLYHATKLIVKLIGEEK